MFNKKKQPPIRSLIADGSQIDGTLRFSDGLRVDGKVIGDVNANPDQASILVISETATVIGEIHADHVIINGTVKGPVYARLMLELQPKAHIEGDIHYSALEMHQGAIIAGQMRPVDMAEEKPTLKLAANNQ
ncbi:MAG: polymer-forming cytoskeletal protein [Pseudomonadota bacterium]|jgi:cytoskeletal protein CcmA (bactofilin family)|uniref:bactofilin family protein n=1 Tax=Curvibacter delicatus TaxID=80879 RepID=UPI0008349693|nr:polymer-forming cytoskeletal protein [Curvibacter delicatus]MEA3394072.1 polymer-forming cytoskeletal protein [Pseudomonadota bacterium]PHM19925.1 MAG: cell shape determination protein CcmA [Curvibacter sp. PD_MW3]